MKNKYTDTKQSASNLGLSFGVVNCLEVFPTHFNPNKLPLILLQISLLFRYTPALTFTFVNTPRRGRRVNPPTRVNFLIVSRPFEGNRALSCPTLKLLRVTLHKVRAGSKIVCFAALRVHTIRDAIHGVRAMPGGGGVGWG